MSALPRHETQTLDDAVFPRLAEIPTTQLRAPEEFCLPLGYKQQDLAHTRDTLREQTDAGEYWAPWRLEMSGVYQKHVYEWAAKLISKHNCQRVLDVGCGPGTKLAAHIAPQNCDITGIDQPEAISHAKHRVPKGKFLVDDLESPALTPTSPSGAPHEPPYHLVICADVIEHLIDPDPMLEMLGRAVTPTRGTHEGGRPGFVLLSTPDRDRTRGRECREALKPEHVREWSVPEFLAYLESRGWEIIRSKLLPGDDRAVRAAMKDELRYRAGLQPKSPMKCHTVLCRPGA